MAVKWVSAARGIRYREHEERRHGKKPDRYWCIQYRRDHKTVNEAIGWWSEGASQAHAEEILAQLRHNWRTGQGPQTLKEMRMAGQAAREAEARFQANMENKALTLAEFWEKHYLPAASARKGAETVKIEKWQFNAWIKPGLGPMALQDIKPTQVEELVDTLRAAGKSTRTQEHVKVLLSGILTTAINKEFLDGPNPCRKIKLAKEDNQRARFLSPQEAAQLLEILKERSRQVHDEALLALFCGLRAKEIFSLTWADVNFENTMLFVKDSKNKNLNRHAYMTKEVEVMLKTRYGAARNPAALIFPKRDGTRQKAVSTTFREAIDSLGWNEGINDRRLKVVFHSLRHTFASWLVMEGTPLFTVSKLLGHSDITMTMRYSHLAPDHLRQAAGCLEGKLRPTEPPPSRNGADPD